MKVQLWTFNVLGGEDVVFALPGNPRIQHRKHSLFHWILTDTQAQVFLTFLRNKGYRATGFPMLGESEEQVEERKKLSTLSDRVWPSIKCPECFWFDPREEEPCLYRGAWRTMKDDLLEWSKKSREDIESCPLRVSRDPEAP